MNLRNIIWATSIAALLTGCGGTNSATNGSYGGYDSMGGRSNYSTTNPNSPAPVPNVAAWPSENGAPVLVRGVNLPVFDGQTGHDLGKNTLKPNEAVWYKQDAVDARFQELSDIGFNVVRIFLFEDGEGLKVKDGTVTGLDETFTKNLEDMVERARAHKLRVFLAFSDSWPAALKSPFADKKAADNYVKSAIAPLARKLKGNDAVFAFDVANNVENLPTPESKDGKAKAATWDEVRAFIKSTVEVIKKQDPERLMTVGGASLEALQKGQYAGLGLDFYDMKLLSDKAEMPIAKEIKLDRPIIIGSFGQATKEANDEMFTAATKALVLNAPQRGYAGFLFANYNSKDANSLLNAEGKARPALEAIKNVMKEAAAPPPPTVPPTTGGTRL
ncbi:MAG TPA: cellulase family glycosylhydrolase [Fimbriimonas sp.]|nr:cellulase family glycosylhydrolase [Fimbriimonas sp.]